MTQLTLAYEIRGKGIPVVFLHAFPLNRRMWDPVISHLQGAQTILVDAPGFGESPLPDRPYDLADVAEGVVSILEREKIERVVVVGLSMGGYIAFRLWDQAWKRIQGMVLANTRAEMDSPEGRTHRDRAIAQIRHHGKEAFLENLMGQLVGTTTQRRRPEVMENVRHLAFQASSEALILALTAMKGRPDSTPLLPTVDVPVLAIAGEEDPLTPPEVLEQMVHRMPRAQLVRLPEVGHLSALEDPQDFAKHLNIFLQKITERAGG